MTLLQVEHLKKEYRTRNTRETVLALRDINFTVEPGEFVAIMGESGSGKSTLLNCLATLDRPTAGQVTLNGDSLNTLSDQKAAAYRRDHLGFVFQDFNLLDTLNVADNIYLPLVLAKNTKGKEDKLTDLTNRLGLKALLAKYPYELSGGQKQRVAIARALITQPDLILADEPTGALDSKNAAEIMRILADCHQRQQTILMVTHSAVTASRAQRVLFVKDGKIFHQLYRGDRDGEEMFAAINDAMVNLWGGLS
ncbi:ABC transporter ATP-binding protein [Leuconostocaceae bacterium ESL0723]|nr:ABC transporter ATP-binding protein [Leuconostocaceae bacterium ESL0723]